MSGQPVEFLIHIQPLHQQRELLLQPVAVNVRLKLREALIQLGPHTQMHLGKPRPHVRHQYFEPNAPLLKQLPKPTALARTGRHKISERPPKSAWAATSSSSPTSESSRSTPGQRSTSRTFTVWWSGRT